MASAEEIKRVLMENPSILVEVLTAKPEIVYQALARLIPWQSLATKDDIRRIELNMATKDDIKRLENMINALGARWGIMSEESFREGARELLKEVGWKVDRSIL